MSLLWPAMLRARRFGRGVFLLQAALLTDLICELNTKKNEAAHDRMVDGLFVDQYLIELSVFKYLQKYIFWLR